MGRSHWAMFIILALALIVGGGCDGRQPSPPSVPVNISWRTSALDSAGLVLQVQNTGEQRLSCRVTAQNKMLDQATAHTFNLGPYQSTEIGILEAGWSFKSNEEVWIEAEGFSHISFKVP